MSARRQSAAVAVRVSTDRVRNPVRMWNAGWRRTMDDMTPEQIANDEDLLEHVDDADEVVAEQQKVPRTGPLRFARMTGSSIAARDAAPWVTDFLNAAYYRRAGDDPEGDDPRPAVSILPTHWYKKDTQRRPHRNHPPALHQDLRAPR